MKLFHLQIFVPLDGVVLFVINKLPLCITNGITVLHIAINYSISPGVVCANQLQCKLIVWLLETFNSESKKNKFTVTTLRRCIDTSEHHGT